MPSAFGTLLRKRRELMRHRSGRAITLYDMAERMGWPFAQQVQELESRDPPKMPRLDTLLSIVMAYDVRKPIPKTLTAGQRRKIERQLGYAELAEMVIKDRHRARTEGRAPTVRMRARKPPVEDTPITL